MVDSLLANNEWVAMAVKDWKGCHEVLSMDGIPVIDPASHSTYSLLDRIYILCNRYACRIEKLENTVASAAEPVSTMDEIVQALDVPGRGFSIHKAENLYTITAWRSEWMTDQRFNRMVLPSGSGSTLQEAYRNYLREAEGML